MATKKIAKPRTKPKRTEGTGGVVDTPVPPTFERLREIVAMRIDAQGIARGLAVREMEMVQEMIDSGKYRVADVARELGMSRQNLYKKIGRKEP